MKPDQLFTPVGLRLLAMEFEDLAKKLDIFISTLERLEIEEVVIKSKPTRKKITLDVNR